MLCMLTYETEMLGQHTASFSGAVQDGSSLLLQNTGIYMATHVTMH